MAIETLPLIGHSISPMRILMCLYDSAFKIKGTFKIKFIIKALVSVF